MLWLAVLLLHLTTHASAELSGPRVAIIGGGVGGASSAHFLRQLLGDNVDITV